MVDVLRGSSGQRHTDPDPREYLEKADLKIEIKEFEKQNGFTVELNTLLPEVEITYTFHIEISENVDEWEAPLILSSFVKRGVRALDPYWSRVWVEQRIVPRDRQNLGMILKENGLKEYDVHRLLILADGRCAQDECFIVPLKAASFPQELCRRLGETLSCIVPVPDRRKTNPPSDPK